MSRVLALLLLGMIASNATAQQKPEDDEQQLVQQVNRSIERGIQWLRTHHDPKTHWEGILLNFLADMKGGTTGLVTLSLLNCGVDPETREVRLAMDYFATYHAKRPTSSL